MSSCSLEEHLEEIRKKWRVGVSYAFTSTRIRFEDELDFDQVRHVVLATLAYRPTQRWTLEFGAGSLLAGHLERAELEYEFDPGPLLALGASFRILDQEGARPFVLLSSQLAYAGATSHEAGDSVAYHAFDLRLGTIAGWTLWRTLSPYALARAFGGPVYWTYQGNNQTGTDKYHYQLGAGLLALAFQRIDIFVEGVPLGEKNVSAGLGLIF